MRMRGPHEEQLHGGSGGTQVRDCANQGQRIKPVIHTTAPDNDPIVFSNAGDNALENWPGVGGVRSWQTEGNNTD
jgi:hypothetical protein